MCPYPHGADCFFVFRVGKGSGFERDKWHRRKRFNKLSNTDFSIHSGCPAQSQDASCSGMTTDQPRNRFNRSSNYYAFCTLAKVKKEGLPMLCGINANSI